MHLSFCFSLAIFFLVNFFFFFFFFFFSGKRKMKTGRAYSLVCGILAVGNRNQTFLQFTTNHLDGERNVDVRIKKRKAKNTGIIFCGVILFVCLTFKIKRSRLKCTTK
jgi:hypothetical protein